MSKERKSPDKDMSRSMEKSARGAFRQGRAKEKKQQAVAKVTRPKRPAPKFGDNRKSKITSKRPKKKGCSRPVDEYPRKKTAVVDLCDTDSNSDELQVVGAVLRKGSSSTTTSHPG
jgi:hypothetical protein